MNGRIDTLQETPHLAKFPNRNELDTILELQDLDALACPQVK
jgi:hypothetical protein